MARSISSCQGSQVRQLPALGTPPGLLFPAGISLFKRVSESFYRVLVEILEFIEGFLGVYYSLYGEPTPPRTLKNLVLRTAGNLNPALVGLISLFCFRENRKTRKRRHSSPLRRTSTSRRLLSLPLPSQLVVLLLRLV